MRRLDLLVHLYAKAHAIRHATRTSLMSATATGYNPELSSFPVQPFMLQKSCTGALNKATMLPASAFSDGTSRDPKVTIRTMICRLDGRWNGLFDRIHCGIKVAVWAYVTARNFAFPYLSVLRYVWASLFVFPGTFVDFESGLCLCIRHHQKR